MMETILDAIQTDISKNKNIFEKADDFFARIKIMKAGVFFLKKAYQNLIPEEIKKSYGRVNEWWCHCAFCVA